MTNPNPSPLSPEQIAEIEARHQKAEAARPSIHFHSSHAAWLSDHAWRTHADRAALLADRAHIRAQRPGVTREALAMKLYATSHPEADWRTERPECQLRLAEADAILALFAHLSPQGVGERGWEDISGAKRDGFIIYLAMETSRAMKDPYFCGRAQWIDADEGQCEGWYDDSINDYVVPIAYMPYPSPPAAG